MRTAVEALMAESCRTVDLAELYGSDAEFAEWLAESRAAAELVLQAAGPFSFLPERAS